MAMKSAGIILVPMRLLGKPHPIGNQCIDNLDVSTGRRRVDRWSPVHPTLLAQ